MPKSTTPRPSCVYPACRRPVRYPKSKRGQYCLGHHQQLYNHRPLRPLRQNRPHGLSLAEVAAHIEAHMIQKTPSGCWEYQGYRNKQGYGKIQFQGKSVRVHRLMLMAQGIELTPSQYVLHRCDNPPCVRPEHLYPGTPADNTRDSIVRGRTNNNRKLTLAQAQEIRERYAAGGITQQYLADEYGVGGLAIHNIVRGETYRY